jgi:hypothetical protein
VGPAGEELYDLETDPGELENLLAGAPDPPEGGAPNRERELAAFRALAERIAELRSRASAGSVDLDAKTIRDLEALGYIP